MVEPVKQSTVAAQASGRISQLAVKAGDRVRTGQLLATIDDRESQAGLQRSRAQTAQAEAELRNAQAQVQRTRELQSKGFVSKAALDTAEATFKAAQAGPRPGHRGPAPVGDLAGIHPGHRALRRLGAAKPWPSPATWRCRASRC